MSKIAFVFPGQGSQVPGMRDLVAEHAPELLDRCIAEVGEDPFDRVDESTRFAQDLEWDSLTVMDFVASVEDEFDILISMNRAAEIETVDQLVDAVRQLESER